MSFLKSSIDKLRNHGFNDSPHQDGASDDSEIIRDESVWRVSFKPGRGVEVRLLDVSEVEEVRNGEERVGFLPNSYFDKVSKIRR